jgi:DNA-binding MarR family transcriptional regulator
MHLDIPDGLTNSKIHVGKSFSKPMGKPGKQEDEYNNVRLVDPTDFEILEEMGDEQRYTPGYLAELLEKDSTYMSNRLGQLRGYGLVERVGTSTMHTITSKGQAALQLREEYDHDDAQSFGEQVDQIASEASENQG